MKKIHLLFVLIVLPLQIFCDQSEQNSSISSGQLEEKKNIKEKVADNINEDSTVLNLDEDDFYEDMLDKMIEIGAVEQEMMVKPKPWWQIWLLRFGSNLFATYDACKKFVKNRYNDSKYLVTVVWARVRGKKIPRHIIKSKSRKKM